MKEHTLKQALGKIKEQKATIQNLLRIYKEQNKIICRYIEKEDDVEKILDTLYGD